MEVDNIERERDTVDLCDVCEDGIRIRLHTQDVHRERSRERKERQRARASEQTNTLDTAERRTVMRPHH